MDENLTRPLRADGTPQSRRGRRAVKSDPLRQQRCVTVRMPPQMHTRLIKRSDKEKLSINSLALIALENLLYEPDSE